MSADRPAGTVPWDLVATYGLAKYAAGRRDGYAILVVGTSAELTDWAAANIRSRWGRSALKFPDRIGTVEQHARWLWGRVSTGLLHARDPQARAECRQVEPGRYQRGPWPEQLADLLTDPDAHTEAVSLMRDVFSGMLLLDPWPSIITALADEAGVHRIPIVAAPRDELARWQPNPEQETR